MMEHERARLAWGSVRSPKGPVKNRSALLGVEAPGS